MRGRMPGWISRDDREPVQITASVRLGTGRRLPVIIVDASDRGCKIRCLHPLPIGEVVQLEIPAFEPNLASVRWSIGGTAGLRFF